MPPGMACLFKWLNCVEILFQWTFKKNKPQTFHLYSTGSSLTIGPCLQVRQADKYICSPRQWCTQLKIMIWFYHEWERRHGPHSPSPHAWSDLVPRLSTHPLTEGHSMNQQEHDTLCWGRRSVLQHLYLDGLALSPHILGLNPLHLAVLFLILFNKVFFLFYRRQKLLFPLWFYCTFNWFQEL